MKCHNSCGWESVGTRIKVAAIASLATHSANAKAVSKQSFWTSVSSCHGNNLHAALFNLISKVLFLNLMLSFLILKQLFF